MKRSLILPKQLALAAAILIGIAASLVSSCRDAPGEMETIIVGVPPLEQNALLYVAEARKLFESNGLKVTVKDYDTGVATMNALLNSLCRRRQSGGSRYNGSHR